MEEGHSGCVIGQEGNQRGRRARQKDDVQAGNTNLHVHNSPSPLASTRKKRTIEKGVGEQFEKETRTHLHKSLTELENGEKL